MTPKPIVWVATDMSGPKEAAGDASRKRPYIFVYEHYLEALSSVGVNPILIHPYMDLDSMPLPAGIVLTGGDDLSIDKCWPQPESRPASLSNVVPIDQRREMLDLKLVNMALDGNIPCLGICLGMQEMLISLNATIINDLSIMKNAITHQGGADHLVTFKQPLSQVLRCESKSLPSYHRQGFQSLPECCEVIASADDGTVEAFRHKEHPFFVGLQWHAEMGSPGASLNEAWFERPIFEWFAGAL